MTATIVHPDRLELVKDLPLSTGGHQPPVGDECPDGMCAVDQTRSVPACW